MSKTAVNNAHAPLAAGPYSQAIIANGFVFVSGQVGFLPGTKTFIEGGVPAQTRQMIENIKAILEAAGSSLDNVVKSTVFLTDINDFAAMNEVYATFFTSNHPARSTVQVAALPLGALIEMEVVALA